jgi:excinuclease ABC subunit C
VTKSELDRIPGIGPKRKMILLKAFGSIDALKKASEEDISRIPGVGTRVARVIYESLHS